ncbi:NAD-dependent epimerase/dehydratase family protein [Ancylobacter amanitiformis]|uniref:Nucleoside-diphosphate-sugar epimerase n=1 Tax=Ancylobacter amanitiformis TaxID=217069 RepID=A0ABU0LRV7_9HYPH|nr:NAD-dependent epimerase/dehydratase family protein [Ancylobacter amanitiformis]MDQ0511447.1 nucleoside-diphosphate-sugar epimerase [Ancylobacter amanitiformis]
MRVLILGGTGAMGNHLVKLLDDRGFDIAVTSRSREGSKGRVRYIRGDAQDPAFVGELLKERWDCVVDFMVYTTQSFSAQADRFLSSTAQYVFLSSARVFAGSDRPITEDSPRLLDVSTDKDYLATDEYALTKARQENRLMDSGRRNWTIIRPYITYGEERLQLGHLEKEHWLYRALHGRTILFSKDICARQSTLAYGLDVARAMAATIGNPKAQGQAFNMAGREAILWSDVLDLYVEVLEAHLGRKPKVVLQNLPDTLAWSPAPAQVRYDRLYNRVFDTAKIDTLIDSGDFVTPREGLRDCLTAFLKSPRFLAIDWRREGVKDRFTRERISLGEVFGIKNAVKYSVCRYVSAGN